MVKFKLNSFKDFHIIQSQEKQLISIEKFIKFLNEKRENEDIKIRSDKIQDEFKRFGRDSVVHIDDKKYVTAEALIAYIVNHATNISVCRKLYKDIVSSLLTSKTDTVDRDSVKDLYKEIVTLFKSETIYPGFQDLVTDITPDSASSLFCSYEKDFEKEDWKYICLFEQNFSSYIHGVEDLSYNKELEEKWHFLETLKHTVKLGKSFSKLCYNITNISKLRQYAHEYLEKPQLAENDNFIIHLFEKLEQDIRTELKDVFEIKCNIICVDCCQTICNHISAIHVYVIIPAVGIIQSLGNEIALILRSVAVRKHGLYVPEVVFIDADITNDYKCNQCTGEYDIHRFHFRDDFYLHKLSKYVAYISRSDHFEHPFSHADAIQAGSKMYRRCCFDAIDMYIDKPLSWRTFDLQDEWIKETPLAVQILLGNMFINKESIRRSDNAGDTVHEKVASLDACLNNLNRNHTAILQQMNTEELMVNYHTISTVFNITSQGGLSRSLSSADRWLQKAAESETSYFETYLKKYPLLYEQIGDLDEEQHHVSMRDCFIILYLDNLVRLTTHQDPSPGQTRTSQICTLPITLKGLPRNSSIIAYWHEKDCEMNNECSCMQDKELDKTDFNILVRNTEREDIAVEKLTIQTVWGICSLVDVETVTKYLNLTDLNAHTEAHDISKELDDFNNTLQGLLLERELEENDININKSGEKEILELSSLLNQENRDISISTNAQLQQILDLTIDEAQFREGIELQNISIDLDADIDVYDMTFTEHTLDQNDIESNHNRLSIDEDTDETSMSTIYNRTPTKSHNYNDTVGNNELPSFIYSRESIHVESYLFPEYHVSPLLCRHPIPSTGRDDDKANLRKILSDVLTKLGRYQHVNNKEKILFAPDYKISKNVIELMKEGGAYRHFLPEFPLLHLRKSKIINLFSAYKDAGLFHLFKYMKDAEQEKDWMQLISIQNIETATNNIKRLSIGLHLAFIFRFMEDLPESDSKEFRKDFDIGDISLVNSRWRVKYNSFLDTGRNKNATFALHVEIMQHTDEIIGISMAERLGGPEGYNLLLGCVKSSLPFSFLNGATSYATFCTDLLHIHYTCGYFYKCLKSSLFTTPHKGSTAKFALDTHREMDHKDAIKGFRPRSTVNTVVPRLTIVDRLVEVEQHRERILSPRAETKTKLKPDESKTNAIQFDLSNKDLKFILPITKVILQEFGLTMELDSIPYNVYHKDKVALSPSILDKNSYNLGQYLIHKYSCNAGLFGLSKDDIINISSIEGDTPLKQKTKTTKGTTIRRNRIQNKKTKTEHQKYEDKRKQQNIKQGKITDCMSSKMNTCQALVRPDCSKPTVAKSFGIKKALIKTFMFLKEDNSDKCLEEILKTEGLILTGYENIPAEFSRKISFATLEFAGIKFKSKATSGKEYLAHINNIITGLLKTSKFPHISRLVICEEKYSFTPDDFKSSTRAKRQKEKASSITHLKHGNEILSEKKLSKSAVIETFEGKCLISNYLARNVSQLDIRHNVSLDVDSELVIAEDKSHCTPIRATFSADTGFVDQVLLTNIKQSKGEAEMAQVDWLIGSRSILGTGEAALSVVTSADIDSIYIHMFALSLYWPRNENGNFINKVYVLLQKQVPDLYDMTGIIEKLEEQYGHMICVSLAICFCMGGNDFLPKYNHITHEKWVTLLLLNEPILFQNLISFTYDELNPSVPTSGSINSEIYFEVIKRLYCPESLDPNKLSLEQVRQLSIHPLKANASVKHPTYWMPPKSALKQMVKLIDCQILYLFTVGHSDIKLPEFTNIGPFKKDVDGNTAYDFGPDIKVHDVNDILSCRSEDLKNAFKEAKFKSKKRKLVYPGTPAKKLKSVPMASTPKVNT